MKVALIGTGGMGINHLEAYKFIEDLSVVAVADTNFEVAQKIADELGCAAFSSLDDLLSEMTPEVVVICAPSFLHYEYSMKCMEKGIHVFCEKPMAHTCEQADKMIAKAKEKGVKLTIGQVLRYWPEYKYLKEQILSQELGKLRHLSLTRYYGMHPEGSWYMDPELCKMVCYEMHIHDTDMVNYLFGLPDAVHSIGWEEPDIHLSYINTHYIYRDKDITVVAEGGWNDSTFPWTSGYIAVFEHGVIQYSDGRVAVYPAGKDVFYPEFENVTGVPSELDGVYLEMLDFIAMMNDDPNFEGVSPESARDTIYLVEKECESREKGTIVELEK